MKDKFQSKAVPRGTRTIWRYLSALFILFTFAIGNVWAETQTYSFASDAELSNLTYTAGDASDSWAVCTAKTNNVSPRDGGFVQYKCGKSNKIATFVTTESFDNISNISFYIASSDKGKTQVKIEVSSKADFSSDVTEIVNATGGLSGLGISSPSNSTWYSVSRDVATKSGYVRFTMTASSSGKYWSFDDIVITYTPASGGGEDPVCPGTLTISSKDDKVAFLEGDKIELTAALSAGNGTISYQWYKGSVASGNEISGANKAKLEIASCVEGDAGNYYCVASKAECSDAVNSSAFAITVAHNPCATYFWFFNEADQTNNGKTNATSVFTSMVTGSSNQSGSIEIDGTTYNITRRSGDADPLGQFSIPANKAGIFYALAASSGSARKIVLTNTATSATYKYDVPGSTYERVEIGNLPPGTYTIGKEGGNTRLGMVALKVCDATFHTITLDLNGGIGETSISALDGIPATKPADPTWEHHRFDGWYNGLDAYDWSANVTGDLTLTAHWTQLYTVTYAAGDASATGDAPTQADKAAGETFTVAANPFEVAGKDFVNWNDGTNDYDPDDTYTVGTANIVLTAQWKAEADKYSVIFKDGETELGTKLVEVGSNPSDAGIDKTKPLFTFAAWQKDAADIALDDASWASVEKDAIVTLNARWTAVYALDVNFKNATTQELGVETALNTYHYASDASDISFEEKGLKIKTNAARFYFNVAPGKVAEIKFGNISGATYSVDGGAAETLSTSQLKATYSASAQSCVMTMTTDAYNIVENVVIHNPYVVSFNDNGGCDPLAPQDATPSVILPTPVNPTANFTGWYDAATGGNKIGDAGASYTPTADIELFAQWEAVSTDTRINALTYAIGAGSPVDIFEADKNTFNIALPYAQSYDAITVAATPNHTSASIKSGASLVVSSLPGAATFTIVAQSGAEENYTVNFSMAPKDGVSIIKVATTGGTNKTVTGLYAGDGDVSLSSNTKMDKYKFIGFTLDGTTLQAGDRINVHTTTAANTEGSHIIFYDNMTDKNELYETGEIGGEGDNIFEVNAAMIGAATAYVYRSDADAAHKWNGYVDYIEVLRAMNPVLTAITIDGRDGEIDALDDTHFSVTIPYESDLAALTVVPTIVRNAAHATTPEAVISNEGAWILGDNTYRVMDKDGDYTDYTITLDRDVLKHTVSFNTHGGSSVASELVEHNGYLAAAPADPKKDENVFKFWSLTDGGAEVDVTTIQIDEDKTFHAVWEAEPAGIKLFDGEGNLNTTNFISPAKTTIEIDAVEHVCLAEFASNRTALGGATPADMVMYNVTTNKAKIKMTFYNSNSGVKKAILYKYEEGAEAPEKIEIEVPGQTIFTTDYYTFNSSKNRSFYVCMNDRSNIRVLQVKVIDNGANPVKQFGQVGYSLNLNKGRLYAKDGVGITFEGWALTTSSEYKVYNNSNLQTKTANSFTVASPALMHVERSGGKYYVYQDPEDKGTLYSANADIELNATGTWYISSEKASSATSFTLIRFDAPKCAEPAFNALTNSGLCEGDPYEALDGTATVADAGVPTYQWYREDNSAIEGETNATYTPTADGKYYVIATNHLAGFTDNEKKSELVTVEHLAGTAITTAPVSVRKDAGETATLTVVAAGKNLHYAWKECATIDGTYTDVAGAADAASLVVTVPSGVKFYKVVVHGDCGADVEAIAKVEEFVTLSQVDVSESTVWNWQYAANDNIKLKDDGTTTPKKNEECLMANIQVAGIATTNDATFNSQALLFYGENVRAVEGGRAYASVGHISFNTTVPGVVVVEFSNNKKASDNQPRRVSINGKQSETSLGTNDVKTFLAVVPKGEVVITGVDEAGTSSDQYIRISKIEFVKVDYTREVNSGRYGTICLPNGGKMYGAALYEVAYLDASAKKIYFDEVLNGEMVAGTPYIFLPNAGIDLLAVAYTDEANAPAGDMNGLYGSYTQQLLAKDAGNYILLNNQYLEVNSDEVYVGANRAYLKIGVSGGVPTTAIAPVPGRRRIAMGVAGREVPTALDNLNASEQPIKVIIDGQLFILRGEQMFDATGRLVK